MKIKIWKDAATYYHRRCYKGARLNCGMLHNSKFSKMLESVAGTWLEVETEFLFNDQFNTVPVEGVTEHGLRVMLEDVEEIEGDIRQGVVKCHWCGNQTRRENTADICVQCGKEEYLRHLNPKVPVKNQKEKKDQ